MGIGVFFAEGDEPCIGRTELYFPSRKDRAAAAAAVEQAKELCAGCRRKDECLRQALRRTEFAGVWGGVDLGAASGQNAQRLTDQVRRTDRDWRR